MELRNRIDQRDADGLIALDRTFRAPLLSFFAKRVQSRSEAEDLTQEVFIRLLRHPDRNGGRTLGAFVFTIAANLLRDRAKAAATAGDRLAQGLNPLLDDATAPAPALIEDRNPERVLLGKEAIESVIQSLYELDDRTRDVFILSRLENMPHREIARMHGISVSMVEKLMMKAIAHLAARFMRR